MNNVAITGKGIMCAIGNDADEVLQSLRKHKSGIGTMRYLQSLHTEIPVGEIKLSNSELKTQLGINQQTEMARTPLIGILAVRQALEDAGLSISELKEKRVVLLSGTTVGGMDITEQHYQDLKNGESCDFLENHGCGESTKQIADFFNCFSDIATISTACSSAANAIMLGAEMLLLNEADIVVAGGAEALSRFHLNGFKSLMILDHEQCRPFDATRAGLNLGEGAAYVVLEREEDATARKAITSAYLTGWGNTCDAYHQTASSENGQGAFLAMQEALNQANLDSDSISYLNAHGTATPNNDITETIAIQRIFGENPPPISSTKSFTGHTTSAAGAVEAVIALIAMQNDFIPVNLGFKEIIENGIKPNMSDDSRPLDHVMSNSFGFGGNDTCLIFSKQPQDIRTISYIYNDEDIKEAARVEITTDDELAAIHRYVKPIDARRMGKIMKAFTSTSQQALDAAGITTPDAIISGTAYGFLDFSARLLEQIEENSENSVSPTYFMQSTHNTASSAIAIRTQCFGYNATFSQGEKSQAWAVRDAKRLLRTGRCHSVLVGYYDEQASLFNSLPQKSKYPIHAISILLTCGRY